MLKPSRTLFCSAKPPLPLIFGMHPLLLAFFCCSVSFAAEWRETRIRMGSPLEISVDGSSQGELQRAVAGAFEEVLRLEFLLSHFIPESDVSRINGAAGRNWVAVSGATLQCIRQALSLSKKTDGFFDPTFKGRVRGYHRVLIKDNSVQLTRSGIVLDLGGIGKGYAMDRALELLRHREDRVDACALNFGGQWLFWKRDGFVRPSWEVWIEGPREGRLVKKIALDHGSLSTSSDRFSKGHIVNPKMGQAVGVGWYSATVWAPNAAEADALSTAFFVLGPGAAATVLEKMKEITVIFVGKDGRVTEVEK